jgi:hypothetical protein
MQKIQLIRGFKVVLTLLLTSIITFFSCDPNLLPPPPSQQWRTSSFGIGTFNGGCNPFSYPKVKWTAKVTVFYAELIGSNYKLTKWGYDQNDPSSKTQFFNDVLANGGVSDIQGLKVPLEGSYQVVIEIYPTECISLCCGQFICTRDVTGEIKAKPLFDNMNHTFVIDNPYIPTDYDFDLVGCECCS